MNHKNNLTVGYDNNTHLGRISRPYNNSGSIQSGQHKNQAITGGARRYKAPETTAEVRSERQRHGAM